MRSSLLHVSLASKFPNTSPCKLAYLIFVQFDLTPMSSRFTIRVRVHVLARSTLLYTETLKRHRIMYCTQSHRSPKFNCIMRMTWTSSASASCNTCLMNVDMSHDARDEDRPRPISSPSVARRLVVSRWSGRPSGTIGRRVIPS